MRARVEGVTGTVQSHCRQGGGTACSPRAFLAARAPHRHPASAGVTRLRARPRAGSATGAARSAAPRGYCTGGTGAAPFGFRSPSGQVARGAKRVLSVATCFRYPGHGVPEAEVSENGFRRKRPCSLVLLRVGSFPPPGRPRFWASGRRWVSAEPSRARAFRAASFGSFSRGGGGQHGPATRRRRVKDVAGAVAEGALNSGQRLPRLPPSAWHRLWGAGSRPPLSRLRARIRPLLFSPASGPLSSRPRTHGTCSCPPRALAPTAPPRGSLSGGSPPGERVPCFASEK